jgi:hypothetical protein
LLHMADGPEANKNLDNLDEMEMEEDLVLAWDALLDKIWEDLVPGPEVHIRPRILHTDPPSPQQEVEAEAAEGVEAEVVAVAVVAPRRSVRSPPPPRRRAKPGQPILGVPRRLLQARFSRPVRPRRPAAALPGWGAGPPARSDPSPATPCYVRLRPGSSLAMGLDGRPATAWHAGTPGGGCAARQWPGQGAT